MQLTTLLIIGMGGFLGSISRYIVNYMLINSNFVGLNTLTVNVVGSLFAGILINFLKDFNLVYLFFLIGFLGSFTTFSTFSVEVLNFFLRKEYFYGLGFIFLNLSLSLLAVFIGYFFANKFV